MNCGYCGIETGDSIDCCLDCAETITNNEKELLGDDS